ncbi:MAG: SDR family NAD(P)-dependent oxidoreductase [Dehalococcoidia bacterium]
MDIQGKAAVITGAGSGIGRSMARALARKGANIIVADIDDRAGAETVDIIDRDGGIAIFKHCDTRLTEDLAVSFAAALEHWQRLDIVCNNAGISERGDLFSDEGIDFRNIIEINVNAVIDGTRIAVREMRRLGGGVIVNTASMGGLLPIPNAPVYAASKAAVVNFTRSLAYLGEEKIRVNAICPTFTDTPLLRQGREDGDLQELRDMVGGILDPDDVARGLVQLVEDDTRAGAIMRVTVRGGIDYAKEVRPY